MTAAVPPMDSPPLRTMTDMGMGRMENMPGMTLSDMRNMPGMGNMNMTGMTAPAAKEAAANNADKVDPKALAGQINVDNVALQPTERLSEAGTGL